VGNNIPVFFIQDSMKFPDVVHAGKPEVRKHTEEWGWNLRHGSPHFLMSNLCVDCALI
jgi:catalase